MHGAEAETFVGVARVPGGGTFSVQILGQAMGTSTTWPNGSDVAGLKVVFLVNVTIEHRDVFIGHKHLERCGPITRGSPLWV